MKAVDDFCGPLRGEVHQDVTAENQIHAIRAVGKGRINVFSEVEVSKCYHLFDPRQNLKTMGADLLKICLLQPGWSVAKGPVAEDTVGCFLKEAWINVGAQNSDVPLTWLGQCPIEGNGYGIRFFARATASAPDSQTPFVAVPCGD